MTACPDKALIFYTYIITQIKTWNWILSFTSWVLSGQGQPFEVCTVRHNGQNGSDSFSISRVCCSRTVQKHATCFSKVKNSSNLILQDFNIRGEKKLQVISEVCVLVSTCMPGNLFSWNVLCDLYTIVISWQICLDKNFLFRLVLYRWTCKKKCKW